MEWYEVNVDNKKSVKFSEKVLPPQNATTNDSTLGGLLKQGEWAWLARASTLHIVSLRHGQTVATFEFADSKGYEGCIISCAAEIFPQHRDSVFLAICLQCGASGGSLVAIYSVEHSAVLSCMELKQHVTCCRFMEDSVCRRSLLQNFEGCLALGFTDGSLVLLDLNMRKMLSLHDVRAYDDVFIACHVIDYSRSLREMLQHFKQCQQDGMHFGLKMEVIDEPCAVQCLMPIDLILGLGVGLADGRLALYDLTELQIFYIAQPQQQITNAPLLRMDFLEPPDDPRPCLYIWAVHENADSITAVLHSLMYEKRETEHAADGGEQCFFESFQSSCVRLIIPLESGKCRILTCQSIIKTAAHGDEDANCLCAFSWHSKSEQKQKLLLFDLNQWYKDEMPYCFNANKSCNYLAAYVLSAQKFALESYIKPTTMAQFNSMQRCEEHFYPNSLSFDCTLLLQDSALMCNWEGAQNRFINILRSSNATIFLEPNACFNEIVRTRLIPQFCELNAKATFSTNAKYEVLLSVALEYNCFSLLRDCAKSWVDGSFMSNFSTSTGITLSTLTDWLWKRATNIKTRCNDLCKGLFDYGGYPLDQREQKELGFISRQLKLMADLLTEVLILAKRNIPEKVHNNLQSKYKSIRMASEYQEILLWLLNIGLLPEALPYCRKTNANNVELVPYPYEFLRELYAKKRVFFGKICDKFMLKKSGSCRLIYIDAFIEHECKGNVLHEFWLENNGDGLYPPTSIESMLRVMLVPDLSYDSKCAILLYFFLDLNMAINEEAYKNVVANFIKFPSVFKLSASLIKTVQAFWNLDHGHFLPAIEEFISPFNKNQNYPQWMLELLIETLLTQNAANLSLRILEAHSSLISPLLKLQTLLANELISEAFHFVRSKQDDSLLEKFFSCCLSDGKFGVIRDLALSEKEGQLVQDILKRSKTQNAENLHFVYLLQKSKYIEAVSYMDEISKSKCSLRSNLNSSTMNTPNLVLSAYNTTMTPVTQGLTDVYFRIKNKIRKKETDNKSPLPLSCQLIKQNANNLLGGIYHSSALSAHFATYYWGEMDNNMQKNNESTSSLLNSNNAPFLRKPQMETNFMDFVEKKTMSYPQTYKVIEKRSLTAADAQEAVEHEQLAAQANPKKRRRLVGEEIVKDLSHFIQMQRNNTRLNNTEFSLNDDNVQPSNTAVEDNFLTLPPTLPERLQLECKSAVNTLVSTEIHSILKTNTPEPSERYSIRRECPMEEEKNIRFKLPAAELREDNEDIQGFEAPKEIPILSGKKSIVRALSVESSSSSHSSSSKALSDEDFYSPMSSQNNSLVLENKMSTSTVTYNFATGPKARKPLARLSAERTEKSKTPEPSISNKSANNSDHVSVAKPFVKDATTYRSSTVKPVEINAKTSSGFVSLEQNNFTDFPAKCLSKTTTSVSLVTSLGSNIKEFVPQISSSKVCDSQSKFTSYKIDETTTQQKISEYSTVLGSITSMESTIDSSSEFRRPLAVAPTKQTKPATNKEMSSEELDTTLGMSSYDLSVLDATSVHQTKSILNANESKAKLDHDMGMDFDNEYLEDNDSEQDIYADLDRNVEKSDDVVIILSSSEDEDETKTESDDSDLHINTNSYDDEVDNIDNEDEIDDENIQDEDDDDDEEDEEDSFEVDNDDEASTELYSESMSNDVAIETRDDDNGSLEAEQETNDAEEDSESSNESDSKDYLKNVQLKQNEKQLEELKPKYKSGFKKSDENILAENIVEKNTDIIEIREKQLSPVVYKLSDKLLEDDVNLVTNSESDNVPVELFTEKSETTFKPVVAPLLEDDEILVTETELQNPSIEISIKQSIETTLEPVAMSTESESNNVPFELFTEKKVENTFQPVDTLLNDDDSRLLTTSELQSPSIEVSTKETVDITTVEPVATSTLVPDDDQSVLQLSENNKNVETHVAENEFVNRKQEKLIEETNDEQESNDDMLDKDIKLQVEDDDLDEDNSEVSEKNDVIDHDSTMNICAENNNDGDIDNASKNIIAVSSTESFDSKELDDQILEAQQLADNRKIIKEFIKSNDDAIQDNIIVVADSLIRECNKIPEYKELSSRTEIPEERESLEYKQDKNTAEENEKKPNQEKNVLENAVTVSPVHKISDTVSTPKRRGTREASLPPYSLVEVELSASLTPRTRRSMRASSLQPILVPESSRRHIRGTSVPVSDELQTEPIRAGNLRGTSVPPEGAAAKITGRRRSVLLDAINESPNLLDSPSTRTRSRLRLNSIDSELETSLVAPEHTPLIKRTRKNSVSSVVAEQPSGTPKRVRRNSVTSQSEVETPKSMRARSILKDEAEEKDSGRRTPKKMPIKRKKSTDDDAAIIEEPDEEEREEAAAKKGDKNSEPNTEAPSTSYSTSRRLTRTQLAKLEKSAALTGTSVHEVNAVNTLVSAKSITKRRTSRSAHQDTDDAESLVSQNSSPTNKRRHSRSSVKDTEEIDDDLVSVSSVDSSKNVKRRSKDKKGSPSALIAIPEHESTDGLLHVEKKKRTRRTTTSKT